MKILVVYDGTVYAKRALTYGIRKAREEQGQVELIQVFDRGLFVDYDAGPHAESMARAEAAHHLAAAQRIINEESGGSGVRISTAEGDVIDTVLRHAAEGRFDLMLAPAKYGDLLRSAPCPVQLMPGMILVPVDTASTPPEAIERIAGEAVSTASAVLLLGIVPIHLYSREEGRELEAVEQETAAAVGAVKKLLAERGIEARMEIRGGYPDEEILKATESYSVTQIMLPTGGVTPSELSKAASMLRDEPERLKLPLMLLPGAASA